METEIAMYSEPDPSHWRDPNTNYYLIGPLNSDWSHSEADTI